MNINIYNKVKAKSLMKAKRFLTSLPFYLFAFLLLASSCDDFLDVRPKSEKVEKDLFSDANGFESAIYGVYGYMAVNGLYGRDMTWGLTDVMAQDLNCNTTSMNAIARYQYDNTEVESRLASVWKLAYQTIGYANNVLQNLNGHSTEDMPLYNLYRGEMLAVRAYLHFDMLRLFCSNDTTKQGIPYATSYSAKMNEFRTVGHAYRLIIADLQEAAQLLQTEADEIKYPRENSAYYKFQQYRETHCNYYAVLGILAKVYWQMGDNANAARYARMVIDSGKFPLANPSEIQDLFAGKLSDKETLWGLYSTTSNETAQTYLYNFQSFLSYDPYNPTSSSYPMPYTQVYAKNVPPTAQDYRLQWFRNNNTVARCLKVVDYHILDNSSNIPSGWENRISGINVMHVSELYLIAADALLDSDPAAARTLYNAETVSRGLPALLADDPLTHDIIFDEYHKEMFCEGQVWYNMKRRYMDITSNIDSRTIPASESVYTLPIPEDEYIYRN